MSSSLSAFGVQALACRGANGDAFKNDVSEPSAFGRVHSGSIERQTLTGMLYRLLAGMMTLRDRGSNHSS
jgi:hypothetical protein